MKEPNKAFVKIADPRHDKLVSMYKPDKITPAQLYVIDVGGFLPNSA